MNPSRLVVVALRLDRQPLGELRRRSREALDLDVGGFVLFGGGADEAESLIAGIREGAGEDSLWFAADLERGAGQQFRGLADLPPPAALARHPEPERAVRVAARVTAREARSVGVNWVLAPVLDLDVEPENPIVGTRSFGAAPGRVASLGRAWIQACQAEGVAACMKHFPGHGRTTADSHQELPVVEEPAGVLEEDLRPFREAAPVAATAMVGHVAYPGLADGSRRPATLEPLLARRLLRRELGFGGPAATDALNMAGFRDPGSGETEEARAVAAVRAGCDLLLYPADPASVADALAREARRSSRFRERVRQALERSRAARPVAERSRSDPAPGWQPPDPGQTSNPGPEVLDRLAEECIVASGPPPRAVLSVGDGLAIRVVDDDGLADDVGVVNGDGGGRAFGTAFRLTLASEGVATGEEAAGSGGTVLLVRSTPRAWRGRTGLGPEARRAVQAAREGEGAVYPVVFGHRRLLDGLERPGACAWWGRPRAERAAARWLVRRLSRRPGT